MSDQLVLLPVLNVEGGAERLVLAEVGAAGPGGRAAVLRCSPDGSLEVSAQHETDCRGTLLARFRSFSTNERRSALLLIPVVEGILAQGRRVLSLKVVCPGEALSFPVAGDHLLVRSYRPVPVPAPARVAERACGVCGMPLKLAPVAACACGTFYHAEGVSGSTPGPRSGTDEAEDDEPLRCFTESRYCIMCQREKTFDEILLPHPAPLGFGTPHGY